MTKVYDERVPTPKSSAVSVVYYNNKERTMTVHLVSGGAYAYPDVPKSIFRSFVSADSVGGAFPYIKKHYGPAEKVNPNHLMSRVERDSIHDAVTDAFGIGDSLEKQYEDAQGKPMYFDLARLPEPVKVDVTTPNQQRTDLGFGSVADEMYPMVPESSGAKEPREYAAVVEYYFDWQDRSVDDERYEFTCMATGVDDAIAKLNATAESLSQKVYATCITFEA